MLSVLILVALVSGAIVGTVLNHAFPGSIAPLDHYLFHPLGQAFLRLIQFVVVPIVFSSLILGLTRIQNASQMGRYVIKLFISYLVTGAIALGLGMAVALLLKPGVGVTGLVVAEMNSLAEAPALLDWLISLIPTNPLMALSSGNLLQVIISAALFGIGIQRAGEHGKPFVALVESIYVISEKVLGLILYTAPIGVFALIASVIATQGLGLMTRLSLYVLGLLVAVVIMVGFYIGVLLILQAKPLKFFTSLSEALFLAFGTASSNAALPVVMQNLQENYGLREEITSFAIPLGTALKRDGSAILQGFNALFMAQIYHIPLTPSLLLAIALSSLLVSFSTPGVPGSGLITMTTVLAAAGLPLEGVAIVAGIDRITDSFKTVLNLIGNSANAVILSHWEPKEVADLASTLCEETSSQIIH